MDRVVHRVVGGPVRTAAAGSAGAGRSPVASSVSRRHDAPRPTALLCLGPDQERGGAEAGAETAWSRQAVDHAERLHPLVGGGRGSDGRHDGGDSQRCALRVPASYDRWLTSQLRKSAIHSVRGCRPFVPDLRPLRRRGAGQGLGCQGQIHRVIERRVREGLYLAEPCVAPCLVQATDLRVITFDEERHPFLGSAAQ